MRGNIIAPKCLKKKGVTCQNILAIKENKIQEYKNVNKKANKPQTNCYQKKKERENQDLDKPNTDLLKEPLKEYPPLEHSVPGPYNINFARAIKLFNNQTWISFIRHMNVVKQSVWKVCCTIRCGLFHITSLLVIRQFISQEKMLTPSKYNIYSQQICQLQQFSYTHGLYFFYFASH